MAAENGRRQPLPEIQSPKPLEARGKACPAPPKVLEAPEVREDPAPSESQTERGGRLERIETRRAKLALFGKRVERSVA